MTEFFAGIAVMAVELGASRLLAPYFSSSQIVWTIIIGTIMIAMALGNIYGGRSADKDPSPDRLYKRMLIAAVWIAMIPFIGRYLIILVAGIVIFSVNENFLIIAALVSCLVIFVYPLFLLGTVTPSLVKYTVDSLDDNGATVGKLGACNTIGSIIGTFLPTFVTIPAVGTAVTFLAFSGILLILGVIYFVRQKRGIVGIVVSCVLYIIASIMGFKANFAFWQNDLKYEGESIYNYLQVKENDREVALSTNVLFGVQSVYVKDDGLTGYYYDYALAAPFMTDAMITASKEDPLDVLILGMGCGTYATQLKRMLPYVNVRGVEIDQKITDLSREYFELPEDVEVVTYDGRAYLSAIDEKYDVIMVDAYQDITIPFQMSSVEFFSSVKEHLNDDGVMVVNLNMRSDEDGNINEYLCDTIASVFPEVVTADVYGNTNRELFAMGEPDALKRLNKGLDAVSQKADAGELLLAEEGFLKATVSDNAYVRYNGSDHIFTDDQAPVELLGMRVIDSLIADEVAYYKGIYEERGIGGLLESI